MKIIQIPHAHHGITVAIETGKVMYRITTCLSGAQAKTTVEALKKAIIYDRTFEAIKEFPILERRIMPNGDIVYL